MKKGIKFKKNLKIMNLAIILVISLVCLTSRVKAEEFNQANRFQYFTYYNSDTLKDNGTGLMDMYYPSNNTINRIQWLYQHYTFDSNYLYDITFTTYYTPNLSNSNDWVTKFGNSCQIYTGTGSYYNCYLNQGMENGKEYVEMTILNMQGTNSNTLWLNLYANKEKSVYLPQLSYSLQIVKKEDNKATSDDIYNATDNVINNNNANTDKIIDNQNKNQETTNEYLDAQINSQNQTNDKLDGIYNEDIGDEYKELPDDSEYQDYMNTEDSLKDKVNQADLSNLSIGIDSKSSSWVWDTLTSLINSHSVIFGMFIAILSIGIIKLALGR